MEMITSCSCRLIAVVFCTLALISSTVIRHAEADDLTPSFYDTSCSNVSSIVYDVVAAAVQQEVRMAASLLRLHFHDCFVNGCDGSLLLDDTNTTLGEKTSPPNNNSVRGFDVVDDIKSAVEAACPATVSCADILALAANASVYIVGGPSWTVPLGRRDSLTANFSAPLQFLPGPNDNLSVIVAHFAAVGLSEDDTVILSGAHTIGRSRCVSFTPRLYNFSATGSPDPSLNTTLLAALQAQCPADGSGADNLADLDLATPDVFDNSYYSNLLTHNGLLLSDEELYVSPDETLAPTASLVESFSGSQENFFNAFADSMVKMGNISPLTGSQGEIRLDCRITNSS